MGVSVALPRAAHGQADDAVDLPATRLAVRSGDGWHTWWTSDRAPADWAGAHPAVSESVRWRAVGPGVDEGMLELAGSGAALRFRVVVVRIDPALVTLRLPMAVRDHGFAGAWAVDSASAGALVAVNAGQFTGGAPWGWRVRDGREESPPGSGALAASVVQDANGRVRVLGPAATDSARRAGGVVQAFQSYPMLLDDDGAVPPALLGTEAGVDVGHRDARLGLCELRDGRLLLALTRLSVPAAHLLPFGPTTPEMAAIVGALGCARAVMLDGGLSSQLLVRRDDGSVGRWPGLRRVPLGLEIHPAPALRLDSPAGSF